MQISKSKLKEPNGYYYETKSWYETLPDMLDVPEFKTEIFPKPMTHTEILETYKIVPYASYALAAGVIASIIPDLKNGWKGRIVYFKENDVLYRFDAFRIDDGELRWRVAGCISTTSGMPATVLASATIPLTLNLLTL